MKKKQPTLTHYTKRLKKVRLARTVTVIATLFVAGVVVAANVLPQVIKSNASVTPGTTNDVINNGVPSIWQGQGQQAKAELIAKLNSGTNEAKSARALYAKLGISDADINGATFKWLYGPNVTGTKVTPNDDITKFGDWKSFGRNNGSGFTAYPVDYSATAPAKSPADFFYKAHKIMFDTWPAGKSAEPVLMGNGWFIALECGNPVVQTIPSNPTINFSKSVIGVTRAGKEIDPKVGGLKLKDQIRYRLRGTNGSVPYTDPFRLIDPIPAGTKLVAQGDNHDWNTSVTKVAGATVNGKPAVAWDFGVIPAKDSGYTDFVVEVTSVSSQICNFSYYGNKGTIWPLSTNTVCLPVEVTKPLLNMTKKANNAPKSVKLGDEVTYTIEMTNTGNAAAANAIAVDILKRDGNNKLTQTFVSLGAAKLTKISDGSTVSAKLTKVDASNQATYTNGNKDAFGYVVDSMPAGTKLSFTITTKAAILPQACDFAIGNYNGSGNPIAVTQTPEICIPVINPEKPHITVVKTSPTANRNVARGQTINYDIVVKNTSTKEAQTSEVTVTDTFTPPGFFKNLKQSSSASFTGLSISNTQQTDGFVWKIAKIPAGGVVTIKVSATIANDAADATKVCNNATITMTPPNTVVSETTSTVCNTVSLIKLQKTAKYVNRPENPQESPANAGDEIEYTLTTTNQASTVASAYVVTEDLTDVLMYADVTDNGGGVPTGTKLIWAPQDIPAGQSITNKFKVKVKAEIPNNEASSTDPSGYDYNMFNIYGNEVNIKINKPLIQKIVDVATSLPETGAAQYALVVLFLGISVYFFVRNKQLTSELAAATVEYQHQASAGAVAEAQNLIHPEEDTTTPEPPAPTPPTV